MTMLPTYFPSPPQGVWHLGPLPIRAYALFIITGIVVALMIGDRRWAARGGQRGVIYDIALWVVPFGLIGGRLYHLATDWRTYWGPGGAGLGAAVRIWDGGLGIWGAVALGLLGAWIGCRRRGIPLPAFVDALAPGIILAQAIGRLGNYFNQELYGRETTLPWGLEIFYRRDPSGYIDPHSLDGVSTGQLAVVVQPTFLYELIWNVLVFIALIYIDRRFTIGHGRLFASYVAFYCVGRFWVELMRDDTATHIAGIRINTFTSTFVFIGAVVYIVLAPKGREDPESLRGDDDAADTEPEPQDEPSEQLASVAAASAATTAPAAGADDDAVPSGSAESVDAGKTEVIEPEAEEPEAEEPEQAEAEEPEAVDPEAQAVEAESEEPEAEEPEATEPEEAEAEEPEVEEPEADDPEVPAVEAETEESEAEEPELEASETEQSEAEESEPEEPEDEEAQAQEPEAVEPEAEVDDAAAEEPEAEAQAPEAEAEADESDDETEVSAAEEAVEQAEASEPDSTPAAKPKSEEPAAQKATDQTATGGDALETRRRWPLRLRGRR